MPAGSRACQLKLPKSACQLKLPNLDFGDFGSLNLVGPASAFYFGDFCSLFLGRQIKILCWTSRQCKVPMCVIGPVSNAHKSQFLTLLPSCQRHSFKMLKVSICSHRHSRITLQEVKPLSSSPLDSCHAELPLRPSNRRPPIRAYF